MAGYTPLFDSVFTGTLCGKYPDTAAWMFFLALKDKNGEIDMTPQYIATITGMPLNDLLGCIKRFMEPDPDSRSSEEDGRKLIKLDPDRPWGWKVVNHEKYREKARLTAKNARETAVRRAEKENPPLSAGIASQTQTQTHTKEKRRGRSTRLPPDWSPPDEFIWWASDKHPSVDAVKEAEVFKDYYDSKGETRVNWLATWRNWIRRAEKYDEGNRQSGGKNLSAVDEVRAATGGRRF